MRCLYGNEMILYKCIHPIFLQIKVYFFKFYIDNFIEKRLIIFSLQFTPYT